MEKVLKRLLRPDAEARREIKMRSLRSVVARRRGASFFASALKGVAAWQLAPVRAYLLCIDCSIFSAALHLHRRDFISLTAARILDSL